MLTSRKIVSIKSFINMLELHLCKHKSKNLLVIKLVLLLSYFKVQYLLKHNVNAQVVSVAYVSIPFPHFYFSKHYARTKQNVIVLSWTGKLQKRNCSSKKNSLPMMPLCKMKVKSQRSKKAQFVAKKLFQLTLKKVHFRKIFYRWQLMLPKN